MIFVIKRDEHPSWIHSLSSYVVNNVAVEHPCSRIRNLYHGIHRLARRDVLGVDSERIRYRIAVHLHHLELVTMQVHRMVLLSHINHANQHALTSLDLEQGVLQGLGERVAIDGIKAVGLVKEQSVLPVVLW